MSKNPETRGAIFFLLGMVVPTILINMIAFVLPFLMASKNDPVESIKQALDWLQLLGAPFLPMVFWGVWLLTQPRPIENWKWLAWLIRSVTLVWLAVSIVGLTDRLIHNWNPGWISFNLKPMLMLAIEAMGLAYAGKVFSWSSSSLRAAHIANLGAVIVLVGRVSLILASKPSQDGSPLMANIGLVLIGIEWLVDATSVLLLYRLGRPV